MITRFKVKSFFFFSVGSTVCHTYTALCKELLTIPALLLLMLVFWTKGIRIVLQYACSL